MPVLVFAVAMLGYKGDFGPVITLMCRLGFMTQVQLAICAAFLTIIAGSYEYFRRALRVEADRAALKLQADARSPLLGAGEQGGGTGAG